MTEPAPPQKSSPVPLGPRAIVWPVIVVAAVVVASSQSHIAAPRGIVGFDKIAHFSVYGLLATVLARIWFSGKRRPWRVVFLAVAITSLFGITDELHQSFTPGRSVELADWLADTGGATLAAVVYVYWAGWRRLLERPLGRNRRSGRGGRLSSLETATAPVRNDASR
jgi:VanZ family protein